MRVAREHDALAGVVARDDERAQARAGSRGRARGGKGAGRQRRLDRRARQDGQHLQQPSAGAQARGSVRVTRVGESATPGSRRRRSQDVPNRPLRRRVRRLHRPHHIVGRQRRAVGELHARAQRDVHPRVGAGDALGQPRLWHVGVRVHAHQAGVGEQADQVGGEARGREAVEGPDLAPDRGGQRPARLRDRRRFRVTGVCPGDSAVRRVEKHPDPDQQEQPTKAAIRRNMVGRS